MSGTHRVIIGGVFSIKNDNFRHDEAAGNLHHASMSSDFHAHIIGDEHLFAVAGNEIGYRSATTAPSSWLLCCCDWFAVLWSADENGAMSLKDDCGVVPESCVLAS